MNLNKIIDSDSVGFPYQSINKYTCNINEFLYEETSLKNNHKNLLLIIDPQNDFMEDGSLPVKGARNDMLNLISFIHNNLKKIDKIKVSLDTHSYTQIFYQSWWQDSDGNHPNYYSIIKPDSKFKPLFHKEQSKLYVNYLNKINKDLIIWPYHCILGTYGHNIEPNLENMLSYFSLVTKKKVEKITKGSNPLSEMYGIFREEYSNLKLSSTLAAAYGHYENIIVAGEAKSHCVLESIKQLCEFYQFDNFNSNILVLEDCTTSIQGYEEKTDIEFKMLSSKYNVILTDSKKIVL